MLAQMAATAGSVAVGSTIGHGISSMLFGGSSHAPEAPVAPAAPAQQQSYQSSGVSCEVQAKGKHPYLTVWVAVLTIQLQSLRSVSRRPIFLRAPGTLSS
jgi:hypothetical protein